MWEYIHYFPVYEGWLRVWAFRDEAQVWIDFAIPYQQFKLALVFSVENQMDFICYGPVGQLFDVVISGMVFPINMMAIEVAHVDCWVWLDVQDILWEEVYRC